MAVVTLIYAACESDYFNSRTLLKRLLKFVQFIAMFSLTLSMTVNISSPSVFGSDYFHFPSLAQ